MAIVKAKGLTKVYGAGSTQVRALDNVDFTVEQGEFVAVIGKSGSGKSTLLHMLGGMDSPTSGKIEIAGVDITSMREKDLAVFRRRNIGFVFQFYNLIPVLSAQENIALPVMLDGQRVNDQELAEVMRMLGLEQRKDHLPSQLSGGQQQRVSIGRSLIYHPAIILADEPTGNLDSQNTAEIMTMLKISLQKYHQTLILITHDDAIAAQADRIVCMRDGRIEEVR
nr:ABC transporter ATP-binding protein [Maliibacterium massiliense]